MEELLFNVTTALLVILLAICSYYYWYFNETFKHWEKRKIPFLKPMIPFGNTFDLMRGKQTIGEFFSKCYLELRKREHKHGGVFYWWTPVYIPIDEEIVKKIMISEAENFVNHGFYISPKNDPLSSHLFNMEDAPWKSLRSKIPQAFTTAKLRKHFLMMVDIAKSFTKLLEDLEKTAEPVNVKPVMQRFTTDIILVCGFGMDPKTLEGNNKELLYHGRQFVDSQWSLFKNTLVFVFSRPVLERFGFTLFSKQTRHFIINMFKDLLKYRKSNSITNKQDLAEIFIKLTEEHPDEKDITGKNVMKPMDIGEYAANCYIFFGAGFETSSSTQTFAIYELARYPECQDKLRDEIHRVMAKYDGKLTYDGIMEMKYLEAVIDETLRLYPVFPTLARVCKKDFKIPGTDVVLDKNTLVLVSNMGIHRDPTYYPDADKFIPDRFLPENKYSRPQISNLSFGDGPRICIGKRFGLIQIKMGLIYAVKDFYITLDKKTTSDFKFAPWELILRKEGDVWVNFKKIEAANQISEDVNEAIFN